MIPGVRCGREFLRARRQEVAVDFGVFVLPGRLAWAIKAAAYLGLWNLPHQASLLSCTSRSRTASADAVRIGQAWGAPRVECVKCQSLACSAPPVAPGVRLLGSGASCRSSAVVVGPS
jgi:hypothetical protein